jgi:uncharacterized glyoxalase superfamily protein PhnB
MLGFELGFLRNDNFGSVLAGETEVYLTSNEELRPGAVCCVRVDDVDALYAIYVERGVKIVEPIETKPYRMREFTIEDPNGHFFRIGQSMR